MKDNLVSKIVRHYVDKRVSQKTENEYYVLVTTYSNGYEHESFLNKDQVQLLKHVSDYIDDNKDSIL